MFLLGLTGDIACGKSTVAQLLKEQGAHVIDADLLVRELYADPAFAPQVVALFQKRLARKTEMAEMSLTQPDGTVNREVLGKLVFKDAQALRQLEALVHPAVAALRQQKIDAIKAIDPEAVVVIEAVKLIESGQAKGCDLVWCVICHPDVQLDRLMTQRHMSEAEAHMRIVNQPGVENKQQMLGDVRLMLIPNNGTLEDLQRFIEGVIMMPQNGHHTV